MDLSTRHYSAIATQCMCALSGGTPWIAKKKKKSKAKALDITAELEAGPTEEAGNITQAGPTTTSKTFLASKTNMFAYAPSLTNSSFSSAAGKKLDPTAVSVQSGKTYEQEFAPEIERAQVSMQAVSELHKVSPSLATARCCTNFVIDSVASCLQTGKSKTTPWGSGYRPAPPLLHGMLRLAQIAFDCKSCTAVHTGPCLNLCEVMFHLRFVTERL